MTQIYLNVDEKWQASDDFEKLAQVKSERWVIYLFYK